MKTVTLSPFRRHWMAEIIRLREVHWGPAADHDINRLASRQADLDSAALERARLLIRQDNLEPVLHRYQNILTLVRWLVVALMVVSGITLAVSLTPQTNNTISVADMLIGLLMLNTLFILLWFIMSIFRSSGAGIGYTLLHFIQRRFLAVDQVSVVQAHISLARQQKILQPALSSISHAVWLIMLTSALLTLTLRFIGYDYQFVWRTTLLNETQLATLVNWLHVVPGWFGISQPQVALQAGFEHDTERTTALWLLSCLLLYAIFPRLLLFIACYVQYKFRLHRLSIDWSLPGFAELKPRLNHSSEPTQTHHAAINVIPNPSPFSAKPSAKPAADHNGWICLEGELPEQCNAEQLNKIAMSYGTIHSRQQRTTLLDTLLQQPPRRLLVFINPQLSADRGSLRFLAQLSYYSTLGVFIDETLDNPRAQHWREQIAEHLKANILTTSQQALQWLQTPLSKESLHD